MRQNLRTPIGVSAEKIGNIYEIREYYNPNPLIDGINVLQYDMLYAIKFKTHFRFIANLYCSHVAKKYKFHYAEKAVEKMG